MINLKINDIQLDKNYGWVRGDKGGKDRIFIITDSLKKEIRKFIGSKNLNEYRWLFTSKKGGKYSMRSLQMVIRKASKKAELEKKISCHTLQHTFATHLIEDGYSVSEVQSLLGYKSPETTYLHTVSPSMIKVKSLDSL